MRRLCVRLLAFLLFAVGVWTLQPPKQVAAAPDPCDDKCRERRHFWFMGAYILFDTKTCGYCKGPGFFCLPDATTDKNVDDPCLPTAVDIKAVVAQSKALCPTAGKAYVEAELKVPTSPKYTDFGDKVKECKKK
jgi:hypothetical protein